MKVMLAITIQYDIHTEGLLKILACGLLIFGEQLLCQSHLHMDSLDKSTPPWVNDIIEKV